jgi:hypothetical protein
MRSIGAPDLLDSAAVRDVLGSGRRERKPTWPLRATK